MLVIKVNHEHEIYRVVLEALRNSPRAANAVYVGKAKPKGLIVYDLREELLPDIPGYLVYRTGKIFYPGVVVGIVTWGETRYEAMERMALALEGYKGAVIKEEL